MNNTVYAGKADSDSSIIGEPGLFQRSGNWDGSFYSQGSSGYYWSSTQNSATYAHGLGFNSTYVNPTYLYYKNDARAVRCVAE